MLHDIRLPTLLEKGFILEKIVRKFGNTSGAIYVPKGWIGKKFRVIIIPIDDEIKFE